MKKFSQRFSMPCYTYPYHPNPSWLSLERAKQQSAKKLLTHPVWYMYFLFYWWCNKKDEPNKCTAFCIRCGLLLNGSNNFYSIINEWSVCVNELSIVAVTLTQTHLLIIKCICGYIIKDMVANFYLFSFSFSSWVQCCRRKKLTVIFINTWLGDCNAQYWK